MRLCVQRSMHGLQVKREVNIDLATLGFSPPERETLVLAIESLQSCLCVGKPDPTSSGAVQVRARQAPPVVPDNQAQMFIFRFCLDRDEPRTSPLFDAVPDGVLDQRLKNKS